MAFLYLSFHTVQHVISVFILMTSSWEMDNVIFDLKLNEQLLYTFKFGTFNGGLLIFWPDWLGLLLSCPALVKSFKNVAYMFGKKPYYSKEYWLFNMDWRPYCSEDRMNQIRTIGGPPVSPYVCMCISTRVGICRKRQSHMLPVFTILTLLEGLNFSG